MEEIWKDIEGYEGLYQISNLGRIKSLSRFIYTNKEKTKGYYSENKILRLTSDDTGYLQVSLSKNGAVKKFHVHRLVAIAFIPNIHNKPQINHIDRNRKNAKATNLEWVTDSENKYHAWKNTKRKSNKRKVVQINKNNEIVRVWDSIKDAQTHLKISHISECCRNKQKTTGGYMWRYKEEILNE